MLHTIADLWNGNIAPSEHFASHDPEVNHLIMLIERNREKLCVGLTPMQVDLFQKYTDCSEEYLLRMQELAFCEGFCLAGKLFSEILSDT